MRILYVTPSFQHPTVGGSTRCYHLIKMLARRHDITLLAPRYPEIPPAALRDMAQYTDRMVTVPLNGAGPPWTVGLLRRLPGLGPRLVRRLQFRHAVRGMKDAFAVLVKTGGYDVVVFHGKAVFPVIADVTDVPLVVDFCDATSLRPLSQMPHVGVTIRALLLLRYLQLRWLERRLLRKSSYVAFISARDCEAVLARGAGGVVVPNGVDTQYWRRSTPDAAANTIVFAGVMSYGPNEDAALFLLDCIAPLIRRTVPGLRIVIVGRDPSARLQRRVGGQPGVTLTGFVPDVRPYLEQATLAVLPVRFGSGTQNKALEAMAMEVPVITTPLVAAGLRVDGGEEPPVLVAETTAAFAARALELLESAAERERLASEGRSFVERHHVWSRSAEQLELLCAAAARQGGEVSRAGPEAARLSQL